VVRTFAEKATCYYHTTLAKLAVGSRLKDYLPNKNRQEHLKKKEE